MSAPEEIAVLVHRFALELAQAAPDQTITPARLRTAFPDDLEAASTREIAKALASSPGLVARIVYQPRGYRDPLGTPPPPTVPPRSPGRRPHTLDAKIRALVDSLRALNRGPVGATLSEVAAALGWGTAKTADVLQAAHERGHVLLAWRDRLRRQYPDGRPDLTLRAWLPPYAPPAWGEETSYGSPWVIQAERPNGTAIAQSWIGPEHCGAVPSGWDSRHE